MPRRQGHIVRGLFTVAFMVSAVAGNAQHHVEVPRSASVAGANVAEAVTTENMYGNPAALAYFTKPGIWLSHVHGHDEVPMSENLAVSLITGERFALGAGLAVSSLGYINQTPGERILSYGIDIGVGHEVVPTLGLGALVSMRRATSDQTTISAVSSSLGLLYQPSPDIGYALVFQGLGRAVDIVYNDSLGYRLQDLPKSLEVGICMRYPSPASLRRPIVSISLSNEKLFKKSGLVYKGGGEFFPVEYLALRIGYTVGPDISVPAYGAGFVLGNVRVDYAWARRQQDRVHEVSLSLEF